MIPAELLFWYELALKMALTAAIVVGASVAVERSGPFIGALIATLPTAAGAAYIISGRFNPGGQPHAVCGPEGLSACTQGVEVPAAAAGGIPAGGLEQ